jgi:uncharacterized protein YecE (DUF72 family)
MKLWIGTSGYSYPEWIGVFYPRGTTSTTMISFYASHFPLVELNFSYYQLPSMHQMRKMLSRVPATFQFIVKAHKSVTHDQDEMQIDRFCASLRPMHENGQLLCVLSQFPQRFHFSEPNQRWIARVRTRLDSISVAVEFRHKSWDRPDVADWLRDEGISLVSVDVLEIPEIYPRKIVQSGNQIYVRLHWRRASSWYAEGHERYDYAYSDSELLELATALKDRADKAEKALVLFNNCARASAVIDAKRFAQLLGWNDSRLEVMTPSRSWIEQGTLFG